MVSDVDVGCKFPIGGCAQNTGRVSVGLTSIRVRATLLEDAPERVAAAGLDHGLAVQASLESRAEADVKGR